MNVLSLFGGIECGYTSFLKNNINIKNYYSCEIDNYAKMISKYNIPNIIDLGDVKTSDFSILKNIDIVIGGSPCTHWSIAKQNRETTNNGIGYDLFKQYVRGIRETNAKHFLYENNYSIHQNIKDAISNELGVEPVTINSSLVSAQNRKRCYWTNIQNVIQPNNKNIYLKDIIDYTTDINKYKVNQTAIPRYFHNGKPKGLKLLTEKGHTVTATVHKGYGNDGTTCILLDNKTFYTLNDNIRKLSPLECERLQTLPDNWTKFGINEKNKIIEISDTQRYKCIGNGWTTDVITHILSFI